MRDEFTDWLLSKKHSLENNLGRSISDREFGEHCNLKQATMSAYMNGTRRPNDPTIIQQLADKFQDYSVFDILGVSNPGLSKISKEYIGVFLEAVREIAAEYKMAGVTDSESDEAKEIANRVFSAQEGVEPP